MIDFLARLEPQYLLVGFTVLGGLLAMPLAIFAIRRLTRPALRQRLAC